MLACARAKHIPTLLSLHRHQSKEYQLLHPNRNLKFQSSNPPIWSKLVFRSHQSHTQVALLSVYSRTMFSHSHNQRMIQVCEKSERMKVFYLHVSSYVHIGTVAGGIFQQQDAWETSDCTFRLGCLSSEHAKWSWETLTSFFPGDRYQWSISIYLRCGFNPAQGLARNSQRHKNLITWKHNSTHPRYQDFGERLAMWQRARLGSNSCFKLFKIKAVHSAAAGFQSQQAFPFLLCCCRAMWSHTKQRVWLCHWLTNHENSLQECNAPQLMVGLHKDLATRIDHLWKSMLLLLKIRSHQSLSATPASAETCK